MTPSLVGDPVVLLAGASSTLATGDQLHHSSNAMNVGLMWDPSAAPGLPEYRNREWLQFPPSIYGTDGRHFMQICAKYF